MAGYVIRGGRPGYDRLALLARERWPDTRALLGHALPNIRKPGERPFNLLADIGGDRSIRCKTVLRKTGQRHCQQAAA